MRMSPDKVKDLAAQIVQMMDEHPRVHLQAEPKALQVVVGSVLLDDLREEEDIEDEVDDLLRRHGREIEQGDLDVESLRQKFRREIARRRGFVL